MRYLICLIVICFASPVYAFTGDVFVGGGGAACSCEDNTGTDEDNTHKALCASRINCSQSFVAPASGTNVVITFKSGANVNTTPADYDVYLDDDRDFSADTLGSQSGTVTSALTEECVVITASSSLTASSTYYILIDSDEVYDNRFDIRINSGDYSNGTYCHIEGAPPSKDHTSGTTCPSGEDLYFSVCVGESCSCD